ncbi:hypothetical protein [Mucilaginibacter sp.]|uniref:hypothetical protein n=1 Tax=Mucilaginibacter sp. TaxID=1882438 RepID=UPI0026336723|nr:hypothetical protein [Mucilaginibacter sp.]MDB5030672.1 hypothetical protein [Mucilaginibacter sp.]
MAYIGFKLSNPKRIFLVLSIVLPFLFYCLYYYHHMLKNAPYRFTDFDSISIQYGTRDSLLNKYDSKTGNYQYLNNHDSLVKIHLLLTNKDLLYLHHKAAELGFWDFPENETGDTVKTGKQPVRYIIEYKYKHKRKKVVFDENFDGDPRLIDANRGLIKEINQVLNREEGDQKK